MTARPASTVFVSLTDAMSNDHDRLDARFDDVRALVEAGDIERAARAFADVRADLIAHIRIEEDILFPALVARLRTLAVPTAVMCREHDQLAVGLDRMADALAHADVAGFAALDRKVCALISAHNLKEERILYPMLDRALTGDETERVIASLAAR
jgi:iron-sulfur cluster repair protein YtfE (RIC family)